MSGNFLSGDIAQDQLSFSDPFQLCALRIFSVTLVLALYYDPSSGNTYIASIDYSALAITYQEVLPSMNFMNSVILGVIKSD